jgi:phospholipase/carboxylesterase
MHACASGVGYAGFMRVQRYEDAPVVYVSHGTRDALLVIDNCSRRVVPRLQQQQYKVTYHEFEGGHTVPASIAAEALTWFLQTQDDH